MPLGGACVSLNQPATVKLGALRAVVVGTLTEAVVPLSWNAWPNLPGPYVAPPCKVAVLPETLSLVVPSPFHQPASPETAAMGAARGGAVAGVDAGLPARSAMVWVGPPFDWSGPSMGFTPVRSLAASVKLPTELPTRLWPSERIEPVAV